MGGRKRHRGALLLSSSGFEPSLVNLVVLWIVALSLIELDQREEICLVSGTFT